MVAGPRGGCRLAEPTLVLRARHHGEVHVSTIALDTLPADGKLRCQQCGSYLGEVIRHAWSDQPASFGRQLVKVS